MTDKSVSALLGFLDWTAEKGLMAKNTVGGRKAAVNNVLGVLDPEEKGDVSAIDLDSVMTRFINLEGKKYNTSSLNVYKSRTNAAISDFLTYLDDPLTYKPQSSKKENKGGNQGGKKTPKQTTLRKSSGKQDEPSGVTSHYRSDAANVFPVPIRENVVVRIHGLPFDLTKSEAAKIAAVVEALAMSE